MEVVIALLVALAITNGNFENKTAQEVVDNNPQIILDMHTIYQVEDGYLYHGRLYKKEIHAELAMKYHGRKEHSHE